MTSVIFLGFVPQWPESLFVEFGANWICIEFVLEFIVPLSRPNVSERHIGPIETRDVHRLKQFWFCIPILSNLIPIPTLTIGCKSVLHLGQLICIDQSANVVLPARN